VGTSVQDQREYQEGEGKGDQAVNRRKIREKRSPSEVKTWSAESRISLEQEGQKYEDGEKSAGKKKKKKKHRVSTAYQGDRRNEVVTRKQRSPRGSARDRSWKYGRALGESRNLNLLFPQNLERQGGLAWENDETNGKKKQRASINAVAKIPPIEGGLYSSGGLPGRGRTSRRDKDSNYSHVRVPFAGAATKDPGVDTDYCCVEVGS